VVAGSLALGTWITYLAWLGWDQTKELGPDGYLHGPYQEWQVAGLVITLVVLASIGGRLVRPLLSAFVIPVVLTLTWSIDAAIDPGTENDGLWPIGSIMIAVGSFAAVLLVSSASRAWTRHRVTERSKPRSTGLTE
jgi:hypothetical protein